MQGYLVTQGRWPVLFGIRSTRCGPCAEPPSYVSRSGSRAAPQPLAQQWDESAMATAVGSQAAGCVGPRTRRTYEMNFAGAVSSRAGSLVPEGGCTGEFLHEQALGGAPRERRAHQSAAQIRPSKDECHRRHGDACAPPPLLQIRNSMSEFQLYCFAQSGNAYRAALMLNLIGADWEPVWTDFFGRAGSARRNTAATSTNGRGAGAGARQEEADPVGGDSHLPLRPHRQVPAAGRGERLEALRWIVFDNQKVDGFLGPFRFLKNFAKPAGDPAG